MCVLFYLKVTQMFYCVVISSVLTFSTAFDVSLTKCDTVNQWGFL